MSETSINQDAGIAYLDEEISNSEEGGVTFKLASILKRLLVEGSITAYDAAHQIDAFYVDGFLPSDPLSRNQEDKGMILFLGILWELVFTLARVLHYDDARQDSLVQLIVELQKLPPRVVNIWKEDCKVYERDPIFSVTLEDDWNGNFVSDDKIGKTSGISSEVQESCDEYVNWSSFLARCTNTGVFDRWEYKYKYSTADIAKGVEDEIPRGSIRNARILAAANYILLAGKSIWKYLNDNPPGSDDEKKCRDICNLWMEKFQAIADGVDEVSEVKNAAKKAHKLMLELDGSLHDAVAETS